MTERRQSHGARGFPYWDVGMACRSAIVPLRCISARTSRNARHLAPGVFSPATTPSCVSTHQSTRAYAAPKAKSTANLVPGSQQRLSSEVARQEYSKAEEKMNAAVDWFRRECAAAEVRVDGRVTSALLDRVRVILPGGDGSAVSLEEVASVGVKDGTTLIITVFEDNVSTVQSPKHADMERFVFQSRCRP